MDLNSQSFTQVGNCLLATLNPATQKQAEQQLGALESTVPNFPVILISLVKPSVVASCSLPTHVDIPAVLLLKNLIKKHWMNIDSPLFTQSIRQAIKGEIFTCLQEASNTVKVQLSEIICSIALQDYPENWADLIDRLLERISPSDFATNLTILKTCHYVFKRYRLEERSDDLYREINYTMSKFGPALLQIYLGIEGILKSASNSNDKQYLSLVLQNAIYANKIFNSLSFQDIPEFIEDNLGTFMHILMFLFTFEVPCLVNQNEDQAGVLEKLASSVAKIVILYASKYEEDFTMLAEFAQATWNILTSRVTILPKDDKLACTCIGFLASVARQERHKAIFAPTLPIICDKIVLPNMTIRESDLEVFEDEPLEFIKRDTEGASSDVSSRHSSSVALVRNLMEFFELEMSQILLAAVERSLAEYSSAPTRNWRSKLLATQVFSAVGARGFTETFGVTRVNSLLNLPEFFANNVLPDLQPTNEALHPLIKLEAIKFVTLYRNQLDKSQLSQCLPCLLHHLESKNYIIHTYAALTVEKILAIKKGGEGLFASADISALVGKLSVTILALIFNHRTLDKMCENYFLIKAFMRVLGLAEAGDVAGICGKFLDRLMWLLGEIVKNPISPLFNHYLFESLALMIKATAATASQAQLESQLVPILFGVLQSEQSDFFPYAFQLFALLAESTPTTAPAPEYIKSLLPALSQPVLWAVPCNIPALVRFLQACLIRPEFVSIVLSSFEAYIGIFRLLVASKTNEVYAFTLVSALFLVAPEEVGKKFLRPVLMLTLTRVQANKTQRLSSSLLLFLSMLIAEGRVSSEFIVQTLEQIQHQLYAMLLKSLFLPVIDKMTDGADRRSIVVGFGGLLVTLQSSMIAEGSNVALWFSCMSQVIRVAFASESAASFGADISIDEISTSQGAFNRLSSLPKPRKYIKVATLPSPEVCLSGLLGPLINNSFLAGVDENARALLMR